MLKGDLNIGGGRSGWRHSSPDPRGCCRFDPRNLGVAEIVRSLVCNLAHMVCGASENSQQVAMARDAVIGWLSSNIYIYILLRNKAGL